MADSKPDTLHMAQLMGSAHAGVPSWCSPLQKHVDLANCIFLMQNYDCVPFNSVHNISLRIYDTNPNESHTSQDSIHLRNPGQNKSKSQYSKVKWHN